MSATFNFSITCSFKMLHFNSYLHVSQSDIWLRRHEQFFEVFKKTKQNKKQKNNNNGKHKNLSSLKACNSKSIFLTSNSFPLIMSHSLLDDSWIIDNILFYLRRFLHFLGFVLIEHTLTIPQDGLFIQHSIIPSSIATFSSRLGWFAAG